jgi:hypothetical protein
MKSTNSQPSQTRQPKPYSKDRSWSDNYIPAICRTISPHFNSAPVRCATENEDRQQASDLIVLATGNIAIGCRVREPELAIDHPNEFTIRNYRRKGAKTEGAKILEGWGDYLFYGIVREINLYTMFQLWYLVDLHVLRKCWRERRSDLVECTHRHENTDLCACVTGTRQNRDGDTGFRWFRVDRFPAAAPILFAHGGLKPLRDNQIQWG